MVKVGLKDSNGKSRVELIRPDFLIEIGYVLKNGADKYGPNTWVEVPLGDHIGACLRHIYAFMDGEDLDTESGRHHLVHAATNLMFVYYNQKHGLSEDFRNLNK